MIKESKVRVGTTLTVESALSVWLDENPIVDSMWHASGEYHAIPGETIDIVGHRRTAGVQLTEVSFRGQPGQAYLQDICSSCNLAD